MANLLKLYKYIDGVNDTPFPNEEEQVIVSSFRYDAKRMGGAPTITSTIMHPLCLDNLWEDNVYATFKGEKYYIKQVASSSYDNTDTRYKHEVELVSERIILDNVYFYDVVDSNSETDRPVSNSSKFVFFGDVSEFAKRLNKSLEYSKIGYSVVIDDGIESEQKQVSFQDQFFSSAIQEIYNTYEIPYYFIGTTIHIGYAKNEIEKVFKYGVDESLLSIQKQNANYKIVTRVTGIGSADNIPYYYPNDDSKGITDILYNGVVGGVSIVNSAKYRKAKLSDKFIYSTEASTTYSLLDDVDYTISNIRANASSDMLYRSTIDFYYTISLSQFEQVAFNVSSSLGTTETLSYEIYKTSGEHLGSFTGLNKLSLTGGEYNFIIRWSFGLDHPMLDDSDARNAIDQYITSTANVTTEASESWLKNGVLVKLSDYGLYTTNTPKDGDTITFELVSYIKTQVNLMPSIYRDTEGNERFYNAENNTYKDPISGEFYEFENPYVVGKPKEHIVNFDDIKPSIVGIKNASGQSIDVFSEFAYDLNDNDDFDEEVKYKHPYFFAKLRKFDGEHGFNLFDHSIEEDEMVIAMTSGSCGSCEFIIGVDPNSQKNLVQVDEYGNLLRDSDGNVRCGREGIQMETPQDKQNDTINNEVWIALKKDINTFNVIMPNATHNYKPSVKDTFVILHIDLPKAYILAAEKKLEEQLIKYMAMNNSEKFNFSISFSRIFFAENPEILDLLDENSRIQIEYNDATYSLYISSYSYNVSNDQPLPEVKVELADTLTIAQNALQTAVSDVRKDLLSEIKKGNNSNSNSNVNISTDAAKYFLRKDINDTANGHITFNKGLTSNAVIKANKGAIIKGQTETDDVIVNQSVHSKEFISGFTGGKGWAIRFKEFLNSAGVTENRAVAEFDDLIVRGTMRVFEFIVSQMLGENDNRTFTGMMEVDHYDPSTGKVWLDTQDGKLYNTFRKDDIILVQQYNGMPSEENDFYIVKQYELIIDEVGVGDLSLGEDRLDWVTFRDFSTPMDGFAKDVITKGDTFVRIDNLTDPNRKGIMQIMTVGEDTPYMDVIYGKKTDPENALKSRFGNLQGIYNHLFGWLQDFGAYIANLYAVGEFRIAHTGEDVADKIEMVRGAFRTNFSQSYFDIKDEENYIKNGTFSGELEGWVLGESGTEFITLDGLAIYANRNVMTANNKFVGRATYNDKDMLRVFNSDVRQLNADIKKFGTHKEYIEMDGSEEEPSHEFEEVPDKAYLAMRFYCAESGTLEVGFDNGDYAEGALSLATIDVSKSTEEQMYIAEGVWNGEGDFIIRCTGDVYVEFVTLNDKPLDNFKTTTETWFLQDAGRIELMGRKIRKNSDDIVDLGLRIDVEKERVDLVIEDVNSNGELIKSLGLRIDGLNDTLTLHANRLKNNEASISRIEITLDSIDITVTEIVDDVDAANRLADAARKAADQAAQDALDAYFYADEAYDLADDAWEYADQAWGESTSNASDIRTHANYISILNGRFNPDGTLKNASGLVTTSEFNSLYSAHYDLEGRVATKAEVSTSVQFNPSTGKITSAVNITADVVDINNGVLTIDSNSATIGGFEVESSLMSAGTLSSGLMTLSPTVLGFKQNYGLHVLIGPDAAPSSSGAEIGLYSEAPSGSFCLWGLGSSKLVARYSSEMTLIGGLALTYKSGTTFSGTDNASNVASNAWVDFLIMTGATTLPSPSSSYKGKILFVKGNSSYSLTVYSCIKALESSSSTQTFRDNGMRAFFCNGTYWYEMYFAS